MSRLRTCTTLQRAAVASALLIFVAAPIALLHRDYSKPQAQDSFRSASASGYDAPLPVEQLLSLRQELYRQTYTQLKPVLPQVQSGNTLQVLPSFAKPQTLAASDGTMVFLEPEPYLHGPQDIVNHTADTFYHSRSHSAQTKSSTKLRGRPVDMPQARHGPVMRKDLVIALTSSLDRKSLFQASRAWRQGVRTHISLDIANPAGLFFQEGRKTFNETYGYCKDVESNQTDSSVESLRAAMTPFLANQSFGANSYKWMLLGEDDTVFFVDNAMKLLQHLDHNLPYLLTDNIQYPQQHIDGIQYVGVRPNPRAPRCLPCNYADPLLGHYHNPQSFNASPMSVCHSDNMWLTDHQCRFKFNPPGHGYAFHQGAGAIISSGLMRMLSFDAVEQYLSNRTHYASGGSMLAELLWQELSLLPTDPGYGYLRPHVRLFDPGWRGPLVSTDRQGLTADYGNDPVGLISRLAVATQGWCNVECEDQLQHTISSHLDSESAARVVDKDKIERSHLLANHTGPDSQTTAAYLHLRLAELMGEYDKQQQNRQWFDVYDF